MCAKNVIQFRFDRAGKPALVTEIVEICEYQIWLTQYPYIHLNLTFYFLSNRKLLYRIDFEIAAELCVMGWGRNNEDQIKCKWWSYNPFRDLALTKICLVARTPAKISSSTFIHCSLWTFRSEYLILYFTSIFCMVYHAYQEINKLEDSFFFVYENKASARSGGHTVPLLFQFRFGVMGPFY